MGGRLLELELKILSKKLGIYENVIFVGRALHEKMSKYLASVDIYVDPISDFQGDIIRKGGSGIGSTTREAMACGTPQVLSDKKSVKYGNWFQGLMYKQLDPEDMAKKIIQLLRDEKLRKEIGRKSREAAEKMFDLNKNMKKWEQIYRYLCQTQPW